MAKKRKATQVKKSAKTKRSKALVSSRWSFKRIFSVAAVFAAIGVALIYFTSAGSVITSAGYETAAAEVSGMVASRRYENVYWWHRDGGEASAEKPRDAIYAMKLDANGVPQPVRGNDKFPFYAVKGSTNNNWEDIAIDENNNIWIGDIGANDCSRNNQKFLRIKEPEPSSTATFTIEASYTFKFPDPSSGCNTWNSEAMFWLDGKMYIFAKNKDSSVYRVDFPSGNSGTATLTKLGKLSGASNISVASISDDRTRLMVASHAKTNIFKTTKSDLTGDALVKELISKPAAYSATLDCSCGGKKATVEGGSFKRNSYDVAFASENKFIYYAKPSGYGDTSNNTGGGSTPTTKDTAAPTVSITSPANNSTVSGTIVLEVTAKDNIAVTRVPIYYDGDNAVRSGSSQGTYGWGSQFDTRRLSNGLHTFRAEAYDAAGNMATSQITLNVANGSGDTTAPTVKIKAPSNNATVSGTIVIEVDASDNVGVSRVDIFSDTDSVIREGFSQGTYGWGSRFDTERLSNGSHTIDVVAYDAAGNQSTAQITVQVKN